VAVHPSSIVEAGAVVPASCEIGPFSTIGAKVRLGERCRILSHVVLDGETVIGDDTVVYPFTTIGLAPQDLKYAGEATRVEIGTGNTIRECCTIHRGTPGGGGVTRIGDHNLIMAYTHIAHDCQIGSHIIFANAATLAGHVTVEDHAHVGALGPVHQFCRIGAHAFIGGGTTIVQDVLPFSRTSAVRDAHAFGVNSIGLERKGFSKETVRNLQRAFRLLLNSGLNTSQALARMREQNAQANDENVAQLIEFIASSQRGVIK
jgi:UDP-N-acetylglucosamine acyltransferase